MPFKPEDLQVIISYNQLLVRTPPRQITSTGEIEQSFR